jgi:hypothetical protein
MYAKPCGTFVRPSGQLLLGVHPYVVCLFVAYPAYMRVGGVGYACMMHPVQ